MFTRRVSNALFKPFRFNHNLHSSSIFNDFKTLDEVPLEEMPLEVLRKRACYEIAKDVFLPEYWKIYKETLPSEPCKLEGRFDSIVNSLKKELEKFFEKQESEYANDRLKSNRYINLLNRPQAIAHPNISLPLSMTIKQPFKGKLGFDISSLEDVKKVQESYIENFLFGSSISEISQKIELEKMVKDDVDKDSKPTKSPASNTALRLQTLEKQANPNI